jgi:hypothetical protein
MPPYFRKTLTAADERRGELELGLGVVIAGEARFYPAKELAAVEGGAFGDVLAASDLALARSGDGVTWSARQLDGARPFQVWGPLVRLLRHVPRAARSSRPRPPRPPPAGGVAAPEPQPSLAIVCPACDAGR